jgi:hypothetical protein
MPEVETDHTLMGAGTPTIYGDYVAPAIAGNAGPWHIQGNQTDTSLCGKHLKGARRMHLHVCLLECSSCMKLGATHPTCVSVDRSAS